LGRETGFPPPKMPTITRVVSEQEARLSRDSGGVIVLTRPGGGR
jgi:hypothetical protein